jgi:hypothetical protein
MFITILVLIIIIQGIVIEYLVVTILVDDNTKDEPKHPIYKPKGRSNSRIGKMDNVRWL